MLLCWYDWVVGHRRTVADNHTRDWCNVNLWLIELLYSRVILSVWSHSAAALHCRISKFNWKVSSGRPLSTWKVGVPPCWLATPLSVNSKQGSGPLILCCKQPSKPREEKWVALCVLWSILYLKAAEAQNVCPEVVYIQTIMRITFVEVVILFYHLINRTLRSLFWCPTKSFQHSWNVSCPLKLPGWN